MDEQDSGINPQFFRVHNLFAQVTYKPGTRIVVEAERTRLCVNVWIPTVDANHPEVPYDGRFYMWANYDLVAQQSDGELIMWLMHNAACFETHETMEFFRISGKCVRDPHPWENPVHGDYMKEHGKIWQLQSKDPE